MPSCFGVVSSSRTTDAGAEGPQHRSDGGQPPLARAGGSRALASDRPRLAVRGRNLPAALSPGRLSPPLDRGGKAAAGGLGGGELPRLLGTSDNDAGRRRSVARALIA